MTMRLGTVQLRRRIRRAGSTECLQRRAAGHECRIPLGAAPRAGVTDAELDELLLQITACCGGPAGDSARSLTREVRRAREKQL
jgi:alkylhydroperoxidase/carboxymuconolactone decarboxylase family protein YurZ